MIQSKFRTLDLVYTAIGAALIAICSWISIPMTVPFTMQTFAVFFVLLLLGGMRGSVSILVYILLGAAGLPVFAGFSGGIGILFGNTGGYIIGFLLTGLVYLVAENLFKMNLWLKIAVLAVGLILCYAFGTAWFYVLYVRHTGAVSLMSVMSWCVFPFVLPDLFKLALAVLVSGRVKRMLPGLS